MTRPTTSASPGVTHPDPNCLCLSATHESVRDVGPWVVRQLNALSSGSLAKRAGEIELAVHELCVNIVDHAFGVEASDETRFTLCAVEAPDGVEFFTLDAGKPVEKLPPAPDANKPQVRGYGLMILEQLASSVSYERVDDTNRWHVGFTNEP